MFLRILDKLTAIRKSGVESATGGSEVRKAKKRKVTNTQRDRFYAAPSKASSRAPSSRKGTVPYTGMVKKSWITEHSGGYLKMKEDLPWWKSFAAKVCDADFNAGDRDFLDELDDDTLSEDGDTAGGAIGE